jgi:hypothetical protein
VSGEILALAIICGAALLAGWVVFRFPRLSPQSLRGAGLHLLGGVIAVELGMKVLGAAVPHPGEAFAAIFLAVLPATVYLILSAFWLLKLMHGLLGPTVRQ